MSHGGLKHSPVGDRCFCKLESVAVSTEGQLKREEGMSCARADLLPNPPIRKSLPFPERGESEGKEKSGCYLSGGPSIMKEEWERSVPPPPTIRKNR